MREPINPVSPALLERIDTVSRGNHYVLQLVSLKQCFGVNASMGAVTEAGVVVQCRTIADLIRIGWAPARFAALDHWIGRLPTVYQQVKGYS